MAHFTTARLTVRSCLGNKAPTIEDFERAVQVAEIILAGRDPIACSAEFDRQWASSEVDENVPSTMTGEARVWWETMRAADAAFRSGNKLNFKGCHLYAAT